MAQQTSKPYISPSQLGMYERCGEQYRRRYIEKEKIPPGVAMLKGSGVHGGARINFRQKKDSHEDLPKKDIVEASVTEFEQYYHREGVMLTPEEASVGLKKVLGETKDSVVALTGLFSDEVAPAYQPVMVEESEKLIIPSSPYDLKIVMDLADDQDRIPDLKTGAKSKTQKDVDISSQLTFYSLVFKAKTKRLPKEVQLVTLVDTKVPKTQVLVSQRDDADLRVLVARINNMIQGITKGFFPAASQGSWACDPRYCGYWPTCKFVKHG